MAVAVSYISSFQSQDFFTQFKYQHIYEFNAKSICFGNSVKHVDKSVSLCVSLNFTNVSYFIILFSHV